MKLGLFYKLLITSIFIFFNKSYIFAQESSKSIQVSTITAKKSSFNDELNLTATLKANESVEITTVVSEKIKEIRFLEGSFVKKNEVLVELENSEEKAILKQVNAELDESNLNYERTKKLVNEGNASQAMLDKRLKEKKKLEGKYEEVSAKLNDLIITTPFDGIISSKKYSQGSFVKPGDVITSLYDIKKIKIELYIPEKYLGKIFKKQKFNFSTFSSEQYNFSGEIYAIDPFINKKTRTFQANGIIHDNKQLTLKPGMMAKVKIPLNKREVFVVPEGAIIQDDDKTYVYKVLDSVSKRSEVKIGKRKKGVVEIIEGIKVNESIIFEGTNKIKDGSKVSITK